MSKEFEQVSATLINHKVQFKGTSISNPDQPILFDYKAPIGDGQGYNGLELLLMSFAGCSGTTVLYLLRKMGRTIRGMTVQAKGLRQDQPPIKLQKIFLHFTVDSEDAVDSDIQKAIQLAETSICPVWQMIKNNTEVIPNFKRIL